MNHQQDDRRVHIMLSTYLLGLTLAMWGLASVMDGPIGHLYGLAAIVVGVAAALTTKIMWLPMREA